MFTRQGISIAALCAGSGWFLWRMSELLTKHTEGWSYFATPPGVGDVLAIIGAGLLMAGGAMGVKIGRQDKP